jgi:integrase
MLLGNLEDVSLAQARQKASELRALVRQGTDPLEVRTVEAVVIPTFTQAAARYIAGHRHGWKNRKHAKQWASTLRTYALPIVGNLSVDSITTEHVLQILQGIWITRTETAKRVQGRIENIFDWCSARKYRSGDNPARWKSHLDHLLPSPRKVARVTHHPAMSWADVPAFMEELASNPSMSSKALRFLILTACRTSEVLGARWSEIDVDAGIWVIPAERMKAGREHRVPLTAQALAILEALPRLADNPFVFPGARHGRPLSNMSMLQVMRGVGYGVGGDRGAYVPHGFRSSFRDWCGECSSFPREVAEAALAHSNPNKVEAAYQRSDLFLKRRNLMVDWANHVTRPTASTAVIPLRQSA